MSTGDLEVVQWFCYSRQQIAGVVALRHSSVGYSVDWLLQEGPPTPASLVHGYMSHVVTSEAFGHGEGAERSARHRLGRLRQQFTGFITGEGDAIYPEDAKGTDR